MIFEINPPYGQSDFTVNPGPTKMIYKKTIGVNKKYFELNLQVA